MENNDNNKEMTGKTLNMKDLELISGGSSGPDRGAFEELLKIITGWFD